jgi:hypothetical protein
MNRRTFLRTVTAGSLIMAHPRLLAAHVVKPGNTVSLRIVGRGPQRFLDGLTRTSSVGFAPELSRKFSGTKWRVVAVGSDIVAFQCRGLVDGNRWLEGRLADGTVGLAPDRNRPGTRWRVGPFPGSQTEVGLECLVDSRGNRWLFGDPASGSIRLTTSLVAPYTGLRWDVAMYPVCIDEPCDPFFRLDNR